MYESILRKRLTRRQLVVATAGVAGASALGALLPGCGGGQTSASQSPSSLPDAVVDGDLVFFEWAEYIDPELVKGFEAEYGVKVKETFFDSDETMSQKVAAGTPYDLVMNNSGYIGSLREAGLLMQINHEALTNWDALKPYFDDPFYDPGAKYSIPYGYSSCGIAWRSDKVDSSLFTGSWNDLWTAAPKAKNATYALDIPGYVLGASLARLGYDINSGNEEEVDKAADELIKLKPYLAGFSSDDYANISNGEAWIQQAWPGDVYYALSLMDDPSVIQYQNCKESPMMGSDLLSIPAAAEHPGTAMLFIDWMLDPEHSAQNTKYTGYPNGTTAGDAAYDALTKDYPFLQTSDGILTAENTWKIAPTGERKELWNDAWRKVRAA